jgi:hypothetical protein
VALICTKSTDTVSEGATPVEVLDGVYNNAEFDFSLVSHVTRPRLKFEQVGLTKNY